MKYKNRINFEAAIKAGVSKEEYSRESSKLVILTWIANELAEANRLKRFEILDSHKHFDASEGSYYSIDEKELEDKA